MYSTGVCARVCVQVRAEMRAAPGQRERVLAVVRALKTTGIRVRNWKSFIQTQSQSQSQAEENLQPFAFGRDLQLLPQHHVTELDGTVPLFLVEACEYLSQHLHTEGLFRKTGSLSRIRALRADLEQGEHIFCPPHDALLQACDVASVLKQFLRELPQPLIPVDLQGPLCQAQALEIEHNFRGVQDRATLLLTALLPPAHARTLRYLCSFLSQVAQRCDENRMEVGNLALVMAPNLLQCPTQPCRLTLNTEKQLDQQTAVTKVLILHADRIGVLPSFVLDTLGSVEVSESTSPADGAFFSKGAGLGVYRSLRRQRRKSVGEMFVDAFSKLKPGRTPTGPPIMLDAPLEERLPSNGPTSQSPNTVKRKASDGSPLEVGGSATKRRSLHDLRVDTQSISSHSANESTGSQSPQAVENSKEDLHPNVSKRKSQVRAHRKSCRPPKQENQVHCRRRSLRFFTMTSSGNSSPMHGTTADDHHEPCLSACRNLHDDKPQNSDSETSLKIPFILINGPKTVVIGSEVDDDPDLLNCSFVENANDVLPPESPKTFPDFSRQESEQPTGAETALEPSEVDADFDDHWVLLEDDNSEVVVHYKVTHSNGETDIQAQATNDSVKVSDAVQIEEKDEQLPLQPKQTKKNSKKGPRPRRSISMPEVALETCSDENVQVQKVGMNTSAFDDIWMGSGNLHSLSSSGGIKAGCKEKERQEQNVKRRHGSVLDRRKDKMTDSDPGLKRTRLSVANRLRSFSALAALLRTPKSGAPQLGHQRGTVRLRRQGARRFSRSFSHDGVPELLPGESPQEDQQAFVELSEFYADSQDPDSQTHLDGFPAQTVLGTVFQSSPKQTSVEDLTLVSSPQRTEEEKQLLQFEEPESQSVCIMSKSKARALDPEFDLHKLLEQQCHVADQGQDPIVLSPLISGELPVEIRYDLSPPSQQQGEFSVSPMESPHSFSPHNTVSPQYSSFAERYPDPDSTPPYDGSPSDHACLSLDGLISVSSRLSETCSLSLELSPPAFQFQPQVLKRRYRDSPRWPSHEVRMTMWKPLPL